MSCEVQQWDVGRVGPVSIDCKVFLIALRLPLHSAMKLNIVIHPRDILRPLLSCHGVTWRGVARCGLFCRITSHRAVMRRRRVMSRLLIFIWFGVCTHQGY